MSLPLLRDRFPYHSADQKLLLKSISLFAKLKEGVEYSDDDPWTYDLKKENVPEVESGEEVGPKFLPAQDAEGKPIRRLLKATAFLRGKKELGVRQLSIKSLPEAWKDDETDHLNPELIEDLLIVCEYATRKVDVDS